MLTLRNRTIYAEYARQMLQVLLLLNTIRCRQFLTVHGHMRQRGRAVNCSNTVQLLVVRLRLRLGHIDLTAFFQ